MPRITSISSVLTRLPRTGDQLAIRDLSSEIGLTLGGPDAYSSLRGRWNVLPFARGGAYCYRHHSGRFLLAFDRAASHWVIREYLTPSPGGESAEVAGELYSSPLLWSTTPHLSGDWHVGSSYPTYFGTGKRGYREEGGASATGVEVITLKGLHPSMNGAYERPYGTKGYFLGNQGVLRFHEAERRWELHSNASGPVGSEWPLAVSQSSDPESHWAPAQGEGIDLTLTAHPLLLESTLSEAERIEHEELAKSFEASLLPWEKSNHESLLFRNDPAVLMFLSKNRAKLLADMHPSLRELIHQVSVPVRVCDVDNIATRFQDILAILTGIETPSARAGALLESGYCLTGDNLLKLLAISTRIQSGVPVVLMGECGCGKTALLGFFCAWLDVPLVTRDLHGGRSRGPV